MTKVAYVVVGWNNEDILSQCVESIVTQSYPSKKIIYVDNNSKDNSVSLIKNKYPDVEIIQPGKNTGFAKGNNIGINFALNDPDVSHIVLLNTDAVLGKDWTKTLVNFSKLKPKGALFQGLTLDYYNHSIVDSTHIYVSRNGQGTQGNWRSYNFSDFGPKRVFGVNAAACLITRKFIEAQPFRNELFDEKMFMYLEDVDLSTRAVIMGWANYSVREAMAYHMGSVSSGKNPGFSLYMTFRNNSALIVKNFPIRIIVRVIPKLIRGDLDTIKELRRRGEEKAVKKMLQGRFVGVFRSVFFINKRGKVLFNKDISNKELWRLMRRGY